MAGILDSIELMGVLIFAIPAALAGLELLFGRGETLYGLILLGCAIGLVLVQRFFTLPTGGAGLLTTLVGGPDVDEPGESEATASDREE